MRTNNSLQTDVAFFAAAKISLLSVESATNQIRDGEYAYIFRMEKAVVADLPLGI